MAAYPSGHDRFWLLTLVLGMYFEDRDVFIFALDVQLMTSSLENHRHLVVDFVSSFS